MVNNFDAHICKSMQFFFGYYSKIPSIILMWGVRALLVAVGCRNWHIMDRGFLEKERKGHENNYIFHKVIVVATFFVSKPEHCTNIIFFFFFLVMVIQEALKKKVV